MIDADVRIVSRKLAGSPHTSHTLIYRGEVLRSQLSPMTEAEIADHIRAHLSPAASRLDNMKAFLGAPKPGRPKKATVTAAGFRWKPPEDE